MCEAVVYAKESTQLMPQLRVRCDTVCQWILKLNIQYIVNIIIANISLKTHNECMLYLSTIIPQNLSTSRM